MGVSEDGPGWAHFWREYRAGRWEDYTLRALQEIDWDNGVFVDIGAWIGPVSLWAAKLGARVLAIEPDPVAYQALVANLGKFSGVDTICAAIAPQTGLVRIAAQAGGRLGNSSSRISDHGSLVAAFALPDLLALLGIKKVAFVKIDIEGYETTLMPSLEPWLTEQGIPFQLSLHPEEVTQ